MTENMKAFMDALKDNKELGHKFVEMTEKAQAEGKDCSAEFTVLAKGYGITLTKEDFEPDEEELSDEELENVSGGYDDIDVDYYLRVGIKALEPFGDDFGDEIEKLQKLLQH